MALQVDKNLSVSRNGNEHDRGSPCLWRNKKECFTQIACLLPFLFLYSCQYTRCDMTKNQRTPSKGGIRIKCTMLLILHGNEVKKNLLQSDGVIICLFKNGLSKLGSLANCWLETWLQVQHEVHLSRTQTRNKTGICFISSVLTIFRYQAMASVWLTLPVDKTCYI